MAHVVYLINVMLPPGSRFRGIDVARSSQHFVTKLLMVEPGEELELLDGALRQTAMTAMREAISTAYNKTGRDNPFEFIAEIAHFQIIP